jgi:Transposase DDE domain
LNDSHAAGYLSRTIHPNKVNCFLEEPDLTAPLRDLVGRSALPMRPIEDRFAVDSSGFSVCKFVKWVDEKYGVERSGHDWVKVHICTGVRTNVVTAVEVRERDANDCPFLPPSCGTRPTAASRSRRRRPTKPTCRPRTWKPSTS